MNRVGRGILLYAMGQWGSMAWAGTQLPVPCVQGSCGTNTRFITSGAATAVQTGKTLSISQTSNNATLNWSSFNISADGKVVFQQPSSAAIALNRIYAANPSSIFGALTANGQVFLINANGFLFGATSTVNVAGMIASSLNLSDSTFSSGILAPVSSSHAALQQFVGSPQQFADGGTTPGTPYYQATPLTNTGSITVQNGAQLTAADGGRLLLAAPSVQNAGTLTAPDGQIILAAGQNVYLQASNDTSLRGLVVQVDGGTSAAGQLAQATNQSQGVTNQATGTLSAARGNITLTGLMVNQDGRISATTSVSANGSVTLEAADTPDFSKVPLAAKHGDDLTIGPDSIIDVLPDYSDPSTAVDLQTQLPSTINLIGEQVVMQGGSIRAPSGTLNVTAVASPSAGLASGDVPQAHLRIDAGTSIDLSGSDATLPMAANLVTVQLRSNELADDPTQRNGALRGQTVTVDVRADGGAGTPIADVSSAIAAVGRTIAQRTETGGTATFLSEGDVIFSPGASINVSGGATTYLGGNIQTTSLVGANGKLYDIGSANPLLTYTGVVNPTLTQTYDKWGVQEVVPTPGVSHYESGYQQGAAAGSIQFAAPALALNGSLAATAIYGPYQRSSGASLGGTLTIGLTLAPAGDASGRVFAPVNTVDQIDYIAPPIVVSLSPTPLVVDDTASLPPQTLQLPVTYLTGDGFTNLQLNSNTTVQLPANLPLRLPAGTSLAVQASRVDVDSSITDLGGALSFQSELTMAAANPTAVPTLGSGAPRLGVVLGDGVTLDVSGQWTNDSVLAGGVGSSPTLQNGGRIALQLTQPGSELVLGNDVSLKADGGAWQQSGGTLAYGTGGAITLDASPAYAALQFGQTPAIEAFGAGTATGGSFAISAPRIAISQGSGSAWTTSQTVDDLNSPGEVLDLYAPLFSNYGFSSIALTATGAVQPNAGSDELTVQGATAASAGTTLLAQTQSLQLSPGYQTQKSGGTVAGFSHPVVLPDYLRPPTNITFNLLREADDVLLTSTGYGAIDVQPGASILADPGASIVFNGEGNINIGGTLKAPGGSVSVQLLSPFAYNSNTATTVDPGYLANLGISVQPTAVIDVSGGSAVLTPNNQNLLLGTLRGGGTVDLNAERGTVILAPGSLIDFSGSSALLDVPNSSRVGGYTAEVVASPGGSLTLSSVESIEMLGSLQGRAGIGSGGAAAAGSLEIDLARAGLQIPDQPDPLGGPLQIELVGSTQGSTAPPTVNLASIGVAQIESSGIDSLTLNAGGLSPGLIAIDTALPLSLNRSIVLETESLGVGYGIAASLAAPYVEIGNPVIATGTTAPAPSAGTGTLAVTAGQLTLLGGLSLQGVANATLSSRGDVQLQGSASVAGPDQGTLSTAGNITIDALRVYPDTFTDFTIQAQNAGSAPTNVNIDQYSINGKAVASPGTPLSAGGEINISAGNIEVGGNLLAPFGQIALTASQSLTLSSGSLVSVSGAGLDVPYGQTQLGATQWIYDVVGTGATPVTGTPTKQVSLAAPNLTVQSNATVNLQGGGDLYAYEWVPGTGGSNDSLAGSGTSRIPGLYAILPAASGQAAPYDPQESAGFGATQTVYLSGGAGIAPGYYALLPPRYALEPGAVLVQAEPTYRSNSGGQIGSLADGTPVVAGYLSSGTTGLHLGLTEYQGFAVYPTGYGQQLATYTISNASTFFGAAAALAGTGPVAEPADAGTLTFTVTAANEVAASQQVSSVVTANTLNLQGTVLTAAASGGRGALVNISAPNLIVNSTGVTSEPDFVAVSAGVLQGWEPSALTLGGATTSAVAASAGTGSGSNASLTAATTVSADTLIVDSGVSLSADQLFLVAQQSIDVKPGASLSSTSGKNGTVLSTAPQLETLTLVNAAGQSEPSAAFLAVSDLVTPVVARSGSGTNGAITLEAGSTLSTGGALAVDAPADVVLDGTLLGKGASWSLGSNSIAFVGSGQSSTSDSFDITLGVLAALQTAGAVRLSSQGNIDLFTPVTLGATSSTATPTLASLTILGSDIDNQAAGNSVFGAASMVLGGIQSTGATPNVPMTGSGKLSLVADTLNLVGNSSVAPVTVSDPNPTPVPTSIAIGGFDGTLMQVAGAVTSTGVGGLAVVGDLTINAAQLSPGSGTSTTISNSGLLTLGTASAHAGSAPLVGGSLTLTANAIVDNGVIAAPSGLVTLNATGGGLELGSAGSITVAGTTLQAVNQSAPSPGGMITLNATGNLSLDSGSSISVAGKTVGSLAAPAGSLAIVGGGTVTLAGALNGNAGTGGVGGSFSLDAGALAGGLTPLAGSLMSGANGGFGNAVNIRARSGDLVLTSGASLESNDITLTADSGTVGIAGQLMATSAAQRGLIDLSGTTVALLNGGQLHADGMGAAGLGGEIEVNATCLACSISLSPGSIITTAGTAQMGQLVLRAPALATNDVAINLPSTGIAGIGADVSRVGQVIIDPVTIFQTSNATINSDLPNDVATVSQYLTNAAATVASRLTSSSTTPISIQAGVELQDATLVNGMPETLTLPSMDLSPWSTGTMTGTPQVINLTVRSAGALMVNGTLSDGFISDPTYNSSLIALTTTPSASFTLVAGADIGSANPLSVVRGSSAGLTLMSSNRPGDGMIDTVPLGPSVVRTGTGDINLVASGDVTFAQGLGGGAAAYTAGLSPLLTPGTATTSAVYVQPVSYGSGDLIQNFGADGGNVRVSAGGNVVGSPVGGMYTKTDGGNYGVTGWQLHQGSAGIPAQYGIDYGNFDWNIGALGGGDVSITAGGNVNDVSAATADSLASGAYLASLTGSATTGNAVSYGSGGGLSITAGANIGSAQIFVASGAGVLIAGGGLAATRTSVIGGQTLTVSPVGSSIALDDAVASVWARNSVQVDAIYNPTLLSQANTQLDTTLVGGFLTYGLSDGNTSAVNLSSTSGSVTVDISPSAGPMGSLLGKTQVSSNGPTLSILPPTLMIQALQGDIVVNGTPDLAPAPQGQLSLFAADDIVAASTGSNAGIVMSDSFPSSIATAANPAPMGSLLVAPFQGAIHTGDPNPAMITAGNDIDGLALSIPKAAQLVAGRDLVNVTYSGQNTAADDTTLISAGRDLVDTGTGDGIQVSGPGSVDVLTGRNLNLGLGNGIVTLGNLNNPNLPTAQGADLTLMVGYGTQGADLPGFLKTIIAPSTTYQSELVSYVESLNGDSGLTYAQAATDFASLGAPQQSALIDGVFFNELLLSGRAANSGTGVGFTEGYAAIDALFPGSRSTTATSPYSGNLSLTSSRIYTDSGGNISILVPGGQIDVGLANPPASLQAKPASDLGIVAEGAGNVSIYSLNDVNVNKSRVFTLGGGNILIWSDLGSIDAGNGSKSSLSVPPPIVNISQAGVVTLDFGGALASGSGIRTIQTSPEVPPGNVDLDAPVGTVNAGDAGIGASGNINIAAAHVIGVDNINFGGTATGVPSDLSGLSASLSGVAAVAAGATNSATNSATEATANKETAPLAQTALSWLDVFVTGLGEENCKQDDVECLKRQRAAAP